MHWIEFLISASIIIYAGIRLTIYADKLSDELQLGKVWIGIVLLGLVTSLPEAITSLVSIVSLGADNLAIGNLLGSNNFNPMLIVVIDVMYRQGALTTDIQPSSLHKVSACFAILLSGIVIVDIVFNVPVLNIRGMSLSAGSLMIAVCYFVGMRKLALLSTEQSVISPSSERPVQQNTVMIRIWIQLLINAVLVIVGAMWLARSANIIAQQTGLGGTFFGSIFLAFVTSLPELVVSISALRLGSLDLAIGNIFGSNMTNMFIVFVCSLFYRGAPLLGAVSKVHVITAALSILLTYVAVKGIFIRNKKTVFGLSLNSLIMIVLFLIGTGILYKLRLL